MIISRLTVCAEGIVQDAVTNKLSAFNIFEEISSVSFPLFITKFCVLTILERDGDADPNKIGIEIKLMMNGDELVKDHIEVNFQGKKRNRTLFDIDGLVIPALGTLCIVISYDKKELSAYEIQVDKIGQPR